MPVGDAFFSRKIRGGIDTSPIIGRGAVKDTYNLVADGMVKLLRALAAFKTPLLEEVNAQRYALEHDCSRYFADASLKGGAELDWDSESQRVAFLTGLVVDVRRALALARSSLESNGSFCGPRTGSSEGVRAAMQLLEQLVDHDIEVRDDGQAHIKSGVVPPENSSLLVANDLQLFRPIDRGTGFPANLLPFSSSERSSVLNLGRVPQGPSGMPPATDSTVSAATLFELLRFTHHSAVQPSNFRPLPLAERGEVNGLHPLEFSDECFSLG